MKGLAAPLLFPNLALLSSHSPSVINGLNESAGHDLLLPAEPLSSSYVIPREGARSEVTISFTDKFICDTIVGMSSTLKIREKLMLLELADLCNNVSAACEYMGISRKTYYQIKKAFDEGGVEALARKSRRVPNVKNWTFDFFTPILDIQADSVANGQ